MVGHGRGVEFFALILPHGMLELSAVFLAAAAGLRLGWRSLIPGPLPRAQALAEEGRATITIAIGLVVVLLVSGVIEAFVTPSPLPTWARIGSARAPRPPSSATSSCSAAAPLPPGSPRTSRRRPTSSPVAG